MARPWRPEPHANVRGRNSPIILPEMAKTIPSQRSVFIAAAIVIVVAAFWAVLFVRRLDMHPEAVKDGAADSSRTFFRFLLEAAVVLLACVILSHLGGRIISGAILGLLKP